jgi:hypothetical protein
MATVPTAIGPIGTRQINQNFYAGRIDLTTIQQAVTAAVASGSPACVVIPAGYTGSDAISAVTGGSAAVYITDLRGSSPQNYIWNGSAYAAANFAQLGNFSAAGGLFTGTLTASNLESLGDLSVGGDAEITGDLSAETATFTEAIVDNSPVRTFANTPDGPGEGMVWPDIGIPVSQGSTWQSPSIPVANVPLLNLANTFTQPITISTSGVGGLTVTNGHLVASGNLTLGSGNYQLYWDGASAYIDGGLNLVINSRTNTPNFGMLLTGNFEATGNITGGILHATKNALAGINTGTSGGLQAAWNISGSEGETNFVNNNMNAEGGFSWYNAPPNTLVNSAFQPMMTLLPAQLTITGSLISLWSGTTVSGSLTRLFAGQSNSVNNAVSYGFQYTANGSGNLGVIAWAGGVTAATFDQGGNWTMHGSITSGAGKAFRIPHPLDAAKDLVHGCVEGPEFAVFYRGEGETANGSAEVMLPDYFEALTQKENRTVQLTLLIDDDNPVFGGQIAAGRVKDGKFKVYSTDPAAKFYWEVNAVRGDIDALDIAPARNTAFDMLNQQGEKDAGTERDGEAEDRQQHTADDVSATPDPAGTGRTRRDHKRD